MSNAFLSSQGSIGPIPPTVATVYETDNGAAIPAANILNVYANDTNEDNDNGIQTIGSGNTVTVQLTNRITGTITTHDAAATELISLNMGTTAGVYHLEGSLIAYNTTDVAGAAYTFSGAARTTGAVGIEIATESKDIYEEAAMVLCDFNFGVDALTNTAFIEVIGIALKDINWSVIATYRFVS